MIDLGRGCSRRERKRDLEREIGRGRKRERKRVWTREIREREGKQNDGEGLQFVGDGEEERSRKEKG